jgi:hypothetical protein
MRQTEEREFLEVVVVWLDAVGGYRGLLRRRRTFRETGGDPGAADVRPA